ncbi:Abi family protein [Emticicia sp. TH156]|uniref:Abi family protein n=1 Tax=Emticicia sp. TH156 TaxID=2067454 RepID=UPI000C76FDCB|nr:Abi family protein [Emticicia sp. TH156]PLK42082.1 CAAX protease [Emticicia sp. TH156]
MRFKEFEQIMSVARMNRYKLACNNDTKKAMTLYRLNLKLSQELFTIISCFEIALRNSIDKHYTATMGNEWLRKEASSGGRFNSSNTFRTATIIREAVRKLGTKYTHNKLVAEMDFGFWRFLFAQPQFLAGRQSLLQIFPAKPRSTQAIQYNHTYVFNELAKINHLRNRLAHHEPICFSSTPTRIDTTYARQHYALILQLFNWMQINESTLLYGLDHINEVANKIDSL